MSIGLIVTGGYGNGTLSGTIGGVVLSGYISSTDNAGVKTTLLENVTLSATVSVAVTGNKTTTLGTTLGASGSVLVSGTKTTLLDSVLLSATGSASTPITGSYTNNLDTVTLNATGIVTDEPLVWTVISGSQSSWTAQAESNKIWIIQQGG